MKDRDLLSKLTYQQCTLLQLQVYNRMPLGKVIGLASSLSESDFVKQCLTVFCFLFFKELFCKLAQNMVHHCGENMTDLWQKTNKQTKKKPKSFLKILKWFFKTVKKAVFGLIRPCCVPWYWIYIAPNAFEDMGLVMLHVYLQIFQCFNCFSTFFSPNFSNLMTVNSTPACNNT